MRWRCGVAFKPRRSRQRPARVPASSTTYGWMRRSRFLAGHPGTRADERDLHRSFRPFLAAGREWYHPAQLLMDHIAEAKATMDAHEAERKKVPNPFAKANVAG